MNMRLLRFSVHARDLSWEFGSAQFEEWVLKNRIVEKRYKNRRNFVIGFLILLFIFVADFYYANAYLPICKEKHP